MKELLALSLSDHEENIGTLTTLPPELREIIYLMLSEDDLFNTARTATRAYRHSLDEIVRHRMLNKETLVPPHESSIEHFYRHVFSRKIEFFHYPQHDPEYKSLYDRLNSPGATNKKSFAQFLDTLRVKLTPHRMDVLRTSLATDNYKLIFSATAEKEWQIVHLMLRFLSKSQITNLLTQDDNFIAHLVHHLTAQYDHPQRYLQLGFEILTQLLAECTHEMVSNVQFEVLIHLSAANNDHPLLSHCLRLASETHIINEHLFYDENAITKAVRKNDLTAVSILMKQYEAMDYAEHVLTNRAHHLLRLAKGKGHDAIVDHLTSNYYGEEMISNYSGSNERYVLHERIQNHRCSIL